MRVTVVDMAVSNVGSVANMLRRVGADVTVTSDPDVLQAADRLVLPGVGAFDGGMRHLDQSGARPALDQAVLGRGVPILGICLGMQLLAESSEEGDQPGLGWIKGAVRKLSAGADAVSLPIPHMGWNTVIGSGGGALAALASEADRRYYFVHSYGLECADPGDAIGTTTYGAPFTSMVQRDSIVGVQFHPEKSHRHGMALLIEWLGI